MPEPGPIPQIKTPWGSTSPSSKGSASLPPIPIPDHTLIRRIGKGSYGEVWLARNVLGIYRAIKIVHRASFDDDRPFERELAGIHRFEPISRSHESQLNILHVGRAPGCFYYVMELADDMSGSSIVDEGSYSPRTLRSELLLRGRRPVDECLRLGLALTTALEHLHRHQLAHRDVKPSNIVFVNGIPKLADIGLVARTDATLSFVGTEGYLPPEGPGTPQADIFSLGKVLYELSTGRDRQQFPELPTNFTELPDRLELGELNEVLVRACAADVGQRYRSAAEMHADLALLQSGRSVARLRATERRLKTLARAGALVTAIAVIAGAAFFYQQARTQEARELAERNQQLAQEKTSLAAEKTALAANLAQLAEENRERLVRLNIANGVRLLDEGDPGGALLWFTEALPLLTNNPAQESIHRIRIQQTLDATPKLEHVLVHPHWAVNYVFSPDGRRIATSTGRGSIHLWDAHSGEQSLEPLVFPLTNALPEEVSFTPDCQRLLVSTLRHRGFTEPNTNWAAIIAVDSGRVLFSGTATNWQRSSFTPDGQWLVTADENNVIAVTDVQDEREVVRLTGHKDAVAQFSFSTNGVLASATTQGDVRVWRLPSGESMGEIGVPEQFLACVLTPDGKQLVSEYQLAGEETSPYRLQLWNILRHEAIGPPLVFDSFVSGISFDLSATRRMITFQEGKVSIFEDSAWGHILKVNIWI